MKKLLAFLPLTASLFMGHGAAQAATTVWIAPPKVSFVSGGVESDGVLDFVRAGAAVKQAFSSAGFDVRQGVAPKGGIQIHLGFQVLHVPQLQGLRQLVTFVGVETSKLQAPEGAGFSPFACSHTIIGWGTGDSAESRIINGLSTGIGSFASSCLKPAVLSKML